LKDSTAFTGFDQHAREQVYGLLRAGGEQHILRPCPKAARLQQRGAGFAQCGQAFGGAVLQAAALQLAGDLEQRFAQPVGGQQCGVRVAAGQ
jgi:hypothetical protein